MRWGIYSLPQSADQRQSCKDLIESVIKDEDQCFIGWRDVPVDPEKANVGPASLRAQPHIAQLFIGKEDHH